MLGRCVPDLSRPEAVPKQSRGRAAPCTADRQKSITKGITEAKKRELDSRTIRPKSSVGNLLEIVGGIGFEPTTSAV